MNMINSQTLGLDPPSFLPPFTKIFAFGDALSDDGNLSTFTSHSVPTAPYDDGRFSNGPLWVEDLAQSLNLPHPDPSLQGGTDFAFAGATTGQNPSTSTTVGDLQWQRINYAAQNPLPPQPDALYTLSIGSNDVLDAVNTFATDPQAAHAEITQAVSNEALFVYDLAGQGVRNFLVLNVPDLGKTPEEIAQGPTVAKTASMLSAEYNSQLSNQLNAVAGSGNSFNLFTVDTFSLLDKAVADPAAFGFTNVTTPVWTGNFTDPNSGHLNATGAAQNSFLFFDQLHPTAAFHSALASAAEHSLSPAMV
jgi:phospholipase/lecithinase/hemolysin